MSKQKYIRLSKGFYKQQMVKADSDIYSKLDNENDFYNSLYEYDQEHYEKYLKTKSAAGITGIKTNKIIYDFDSKDINQARTDASILVDRLLQNGLNQNDFLIYFSGAKGFHIDIRTNQEFTRPEYEALLFNTAGDLATLDTRVTDEQRLFRTPLTKHNKSGLYKVPISIDELKNLPIEEIQEKARIVDLKHKVKVKSQKIITLPETLIELTKKQKIQEKKTSLDAKLIEEGLKYTEIDFSKMPKYMKPERWALAQGYFEAGERNDALHVLATFYKSLGFDELETTNLLLSAAEKQAKRTGQDKFSEKEIKSNIINHVFGPNFKGGIYTVENSDILRKTVERCGIKETTRSLVDLTKPKLITNIGNKFKDYVKNFDKNRILTGIKSLDDNIVLSVGANCAIVGSPGSGKTSLALNILNNTSKAGIKSVFVSLDMHSTRLYEKMLYKVSGLSRDSLYKAFENDQEEVLIKKIEEEFGNVYFMDKTATTVKDIQDYILKCEQESGEKIKLVMIDYFERVHSDVNDDFAASKRVASEIQDLVSNLDLCSITLVQPNKVSGDMSQPITSYSSIKGSSFLAQSFRMILSIYREGYNPLDNSFDKFITINTIKNDLGEPCSLDFKWNGRKGEISEMSSDDEAELAELRKMLAAKDKDFSFE